MNNSQPRTLEECEACIKKSFIEAGQAFKEIRDKGLYKVKFNRFEDYCRETWQYSRRHIHRLIEASDLAIEQDCDINVTNLGSTSLAQIAVLPTPEARKEVIEEVTAGGKKPTVKEVKEAVDNKIVNMSPLVGAINEVAKSAQKRIDAREKKQEEKQVAQEAYTKKIEESTIEDIEEQFEMAWWIFTERYPKFSLEVLRDMAIKVVTKYAKKKKIA